jgi:abhydrolase domain-containing protein 5
MNDVLSFHSSRFSKIESARRSAWNKTGPKQLETAEMKIFETLKSHFDGCYVPVLNGSERIWTVYANKTSNNIPIVLIHGFGGGVGLWSLNLDEICSNRPVYAIDLPGFARSSRPLFSIDPAQAEKEFINMIEEWRIGIGLNEQFILLGHSFGGFLSASYAINYPKYIKQLVLIDPWGFARRPENIWQTGRLQRVPTWLRSFSSVMMRVSPLTGLRAAGPFGNLIILYC